MLESPIKQAYTEKLSFFIVRFKQITDDASRDDTHNRNFLARFCICAREICAGLFLCQILIFTIH